MKRTVLIVCLMLCFVCLVSCGHEHAWGAWESTRAATCTQDGERTRTCTCGETQTEPVAATGHAYTLEVAVQAATCTESGERTLACTCGAESTEVIPAAGHVVEYVYQKDATAVRDGTASGVCGVCEETVTITLEESSDGIREAFDGVTVSILGDSISTFLNVSNGDAADTTNSTIRDGVLYYDAQKIRDLGVSLDDTWWKRTADAIGAQVLVNNSWSGSYIKDASTNTTSTPGAYVSRAEQLHDDTGDNAGQKPDLIFVYMGTNDFAKYKANCGAAADIDMTLIAQHSGDASYTPKTVAEAYAIMLYKMQAAYPEAEIYCLNVLEFAGSDKTALTAFNGMLKDVAALFDATYVDICAESGIRDDESYETFVPSDDGDGTKNSLHPNAAGMERIADCVTRAVLEHSAFAPDPASWILTEHASR